MIQVRHIEIGKKISFFLFIAIIASFFSSCVGLRQSTETVLLPAEMVFPATIKNAILIDNSVPAPKGWANLTHYTQFVDKGTRVVREIPDPIKVQNLSKTCIYNAYNTLVSNSFFDTVMVYTQNIRDQRFAPNDNLLNPYIVSILDSSSADVAILLNEFTYKSLVTNYFVDDSYYFPPEYDVMYKSSWTVLTKTDRQTFSIFDTLKWEVREKLPLREDGIIDAAWACGAKMAKKIVPYSTTVKRSYYNSGNLALIEASRYVVNNQIDKAALVWEKLYQSSKGTRRGNAAFNMAYYYEKIGDLKQAEDWIKLSIDAYKPNSSDVMFAQKYYKVLQKRIVEVAVVKQQFLGAK